MRRLYRRVKRLIEWIPVIWKTEDYDHAYTFEVFAYSLKRLQTDIKNGYHAHPEKDVKKIQTVLNVLDRIIKDEYGEAFSELLDRKYGPSHIEFEDILGGEFSCLFERNERRNSPECRKDLKKQIHHEAFLVNQDYELLGKYLRKYHRSWWN